MRFNPPPGWPSPPPGFVPPPGWQPDPSWPPAPEGWAFWLPDNTGVDPRAPLKRAAKWSGIAAIILAAGLAAVAITFVVARVGPSVGSSLLGRTPTTPVDEHIHLRAGRYVVYERTGGSTTVGAVSVTNDASVTITAADVVVTGPSGDPVETRPYTSNSTITRNGKIFTAAVLFHASVTGTYEIQISSPQPRQIIIGEDLGSTFRAILGWLPALFASMVLLVAGIVLLVNGPRQAAARASAR